MGWRALRATVERHHELALAATFVRDGGLGARRDRGAGAAPRRGGSTGPGAALGPGSPRGRGDLRGHPRVACADPARGGPRAHGGDGGDGPGGGAPADRLRRARRHRAAHRERQAARRDRPGPCRRATPIAPARELAKAAERLQGAVVETRRVLAALRPSAVDSLGLAEAIRRSLEETGQEAGWSTRFRDGLGGVRLSPAVETAVFRIVQETLANAARHARSAKRGGRAWDSARSGFACKCATTAWACSRARRRAPREGSVWRACASARACSAGPARSRARAGGGTCVTVELPVRGPEREERHG